MGNQVVGVKYEVELEDSIPWQDFYGDREDAAENDRLIEANLLEYYWIRSVVTVYFGKGGEREYSDSISGVGVLWDTNEHSADSRKFLRSMVKETANEAFAQARNSAKVSEQSIREAKVDLDELIEADSRL